MWGNASELLWFFYLLTLLALEMVKVQVAMIFGLIETFGRGNYEEWVIVMFVPVILGVDQSGL